MWQSDTSFFDKGAARETSLVPLVILCIIGWNLLPFKAWTRYIIGVEGFNVGDLVLVAVGIGQVRGLVRDSHRDLLAAAILVLWAVGALSAAKSLFAGEDTRDILRVIRAMGFWVLVPMIKSSISTATEIKRFFRAVAWLLCFATLSIVVYSLVPQWIPSNDEVASARDEWFGGFERVFTMGMWGVFPGLVFALGALMSLPRNRLPVVAVILFFSFGLSFTFVRTFFILSVFALLAFAIRTPGKAIRPIVVVVLFVCVVLVLGIVPNAVIEPFAAAANRVQFFTTSDFRTSDFDRVDPTDSESLGTMIWRLMEADAAFEAMQTSNDHFFGTLGRSYSMVDGFVSSIPHISYLSIYYCHGILGVLGYVFFLGVATSRFIRNGNSPQPSSWRWVHRVCLVTWICLLLGAFTAPLFFYPYGVVSLALTLAISEAVVTIKQEQDDVERDLWTI
jgi:hypothetical protein